MIKWVVLAVAVYVLYRLFANDWKRKQEKEDDASEQERKVATGEMVKDPECGAYIEADSIISVRDGETVHRFCSYECRDKFLQRLQAGGRQIPAKEKQDDE
ncbi:MAG: transcriptional regulator [Desulfovibrionaceae bacterium]|jgi:YHS domain-containing protein|nr:transcriptional regulator [Desulfovibrionaceae bacterium]